MTPKIDGTTHVARGGEDKPGLPLCGTAAESGDLVTYYVENTDCAACLSLMEIGELRGKVHRDDGRVYERCGAMLRGDLLTREPPRVTCPVCFESMFMKVQGKAKRWYDPSTKVATYEIESDLTYPGTTQATVSF